MRLAAEPQPRAANAGSREYRARRLLVCADLLGPEPGIGLLGAARDSPRGRSRAVGGCITLPLWIALFTAYGLYGAGLRRVGHGTVDDIPALAHALLVGAVAMWLYLQITPPGKLAFSELLVFVGLAFVLAWPLRSAGPRKLAAAHVRRRAGAVRRQRADDADPRAPDARASRGTA